MSTELFLPDIFSYDDFNLYLQDYYRIKKMLKAGYSYRVFARSAGVKSHSLLRSIVAGKRTLTRDIALKIVNACGLNDIESRYFLVLVDYKQSKSQIDQNRYMSELLALRSLSQRDCLKEMEIPVLSNWFSLALIELVRTKDFSANPEWISKKFEGLVSVEEVNHTISLMVQIGALKWEADKLVQNQTMVIADGSVSPKLAKQYHIRMASLGSEALQKIEKSKREFLASSISIRLEDLDFIKAEIQNFEAKLSEFSFRSKDTTDVFQLNIQFFPLTNCKASAA